MPNRVNLGRMDDMPIILSIEECKQGTDAWYKTRHGLPTASGFSKIIKANGERSQSRQKYLEDLAYERLTGLSANPFENSAMRRGKLMEQESREMFEMSMDIEVNQVGIVFKDERRITACSPDGLCSDGNGWESKDAIPRIQLERLERGTLPSEHYHQVQGSMWICELDGWWFRSYCRGMRPLNLLIRRDEKFIKTLAVEVEAFSYELNEFVDKCRKA